MSQDCERRVETKAGQPSVEQVLDEQTQQNGFQAKVGWANACCSDMTARGLENESGNFAWYHSIRGVWLLLELLAIVLLLLVVEIRNLTWIQTHAFSNQFGRCKILHDHSLVHSYTASSWYDNPNECERRIQAFSIQCAHYSVLRIVQWCTLFYGEHYSMARI